MSSEAVTEEEDRSTIPEFVLPEDPTEEAAPYQRSARRVIPSFSNDADSPNSSATNAQFSQNAQSDGDSPKLTIKNLLRKVVGGIVKPISGRVKPVTDCITKMGWTLLTLDVVIWILAATFGWRELSYTAAVLACLFVGSCLFTVGRLSVIGELLLHPRRVRVGGSATAYFMLRNNSKMPLVGLNLELPVGDEVARFGVPSMGDSERYEDVVVIPTDTRGVVAVGPLRTQRGDPFGFVRRELTWGRTYELFIHPRVTQLHSLGTGLLRDLEGQTAQNLSPSDLAFHALREYVPGDDLRHVHWSSSARMSAIGPEQKLMVREFLDTRRSHIVVISDVESEVFSSESEFETAISCAASIVLRACTDEMGVSLLCGDWQSIRPIRQVALDCYSRFGMGDTQLARQAMKVSLVAADASLVVLVTGREAEFSELVMCRAAIPTDVAMLVIRVSEDEKTSLRQSEGFSELTVGSLEALPAALLERVGS